MDEFVVGSAKQCVAGVRPEARPIDQALWMFYAETDGEWLGFHDDTGCVQHGEGVASAVAERQHHLIGGGWRPRSPI